MDMQQMMQQARQFQQRLEQIQKDLATKRVTASAGGGMVSVTMNGVGEVVSLVMEKQIIDPAEQEMLQDLVVAAVNSATVKVKELAKNEMRQLTGGLSIPGLF